MKVSAIVAAAGQSKRMKKHVSKNKLLLKIGNKPILLHTLSNVFNSKIDECIIVYREKEIFNLIKNLDIKIVKVDKVPLSYSLLSGVKECNNEICLCVAGDQPFVTSETFNNLIKTSIKKDVLSILGRKGKEGYVENVEGLGMPFVTRKELLLRYLPQYPGNINPILKKMLNNNVKIYAIPPLKEIELLNINTYKDYLLAKRLSSS